MEQYQLKPRDSIHLASALKREVSEIITFDNDFKHVKEITSFPPS